MDVSPIQEWAFLLHTQQPGAEMLLPMLQAQTSFVPQPQPSPSPSRSTPSPKTLHKTKQRPSGRPPKYLADANYEVDILNDSPQNYVETTPRIRKLRQNLATQQCRLNRERNVRNVVFKLAEILQKRENSPDASSCRCCSHLFEGVDDAFKAMLKDEVDRERRRMERKKQPAKPTTTDTVKHLLV